MHVVMIAADDECRSEESIPLLARMLRNAFGFRVTVLFSVNHDTGLIDPAARRNIPGLEILEEADLLVVFARFRAIPLSQRIHILNFVGSGKPVVGFRTSTHLFLYPDDYKMPEDNKRYLNQDWPISVFGQRWITHHGHFDDGEYPLTHIELAPDKKNHPILRGVTSFDAYSWLYHVEGAGDVLSGNDNCRLLFGRARRSSENPVSADFDSQRPSARYIPIENPVAWTRTHPVNGRVFFTTLGDAYDFKEAAFRKLCLNGIIWALGMEDEIPEHGAPSEIVGGYDPLNSGIGTFRQDLCALKIQQEIDAIEG